jgi:hypothetical protein
METGVLVPPQSSSFSDFWEWGGVDCQRRSKIDDEDQDEDDWGRR